MSVAAPRFGFLGTAGVANHKVDSQELLATASLRPRKCTTLDLDCASLFELSFGQITIINDYHDITAV